MNDQWSGNTLLSAWRVNEAERSRSSIHRETLLSTGPAPVARADRFLVIALGDHEPFPVDTDRQLREGAGGGPERRLGALPHGERRLVTGAEQLLGLRLVEADRAAGVGADLGEGDDAVHA